MGIKQAIVSGVVGCMILFASTGAASADAFATISVLDPGHGDVSALLASGYVSETTIGPLAPGDPDINLVFQVTLGGIDDPATALPTPPIIDLFDYKVQVLTGGALPVGVAFNGPLTEGLSEASDGDGVFPADSVIASHPYIFSDGGGGLDAEYNNSKAHTFIVSDVGIATDVTDVATSPLSMGLLVLTISSNAAPGVYVISDYTTDIGFKGFLSRLQTTQERLSVDNFQFEIIPEPATMSLLMLGGLGVMARRRRNR